MTVPGRVPAPGDTLPQVTDGVRHLFQNAADAEGLADVVSSVADHETRITTLEGAGGGGAVDNLLVNGAFRIDQRNEGASTSISDDSYCFDQWYILTQTGAVAVSQLTDPEDGYTHAIRVTQSQASAQRFGVAQIIEGKSCKHLRGGSSTLVPRVRISSSQAIRYAILGWTGTEDSVTSDVVNDWTSSTYTASNFFLGSNLSVLAVDTQTPSANTWTSLDALTATMGSSFNNVIVFIWTEGTAAQNVTLDLDFVQLESGTSASSFERTIYSQDLAECLRYCLAIVATNASTGIFTSMAFSSTLILIGYTYPMPMFAAPSVSYSDLSHFGLITSTGVPITPTSITLSNPSRTSTRIDIACASGLTANDAVFVQFASPSGRLFLTAPL